MAKPKPSAKPKPKGKPKPTPKAKPKPKATPKAKPKPKATRVPGGDAAVKAYIDALPGWKKAVAQRIDAVIAREVPGVQRAVKWNMPFYGVEGHGWFLRFAAYSKHLNLRFFAGTALRPEPPVGEMDRRGLHLTEKDALDEKQLASWVRQAAAMPGYFA